MKKIFPIVGAAIVISLAVALWLSKEGAADLPAAATITFANGGYEPKEVSIKVGEKVTFVNGSEAEYMWPASNLHPTHELYPEFDPREPIGPGDSWSFVFEKRGMWGFHDHLFSNRRGTVNVEE